MATVQLFVENESNRRLLSAALDGDHRVQTGSGDPEAFLDSDVDLCVFDGPAFRGQQSVFAEKKARAAPVFLPYLLLLGDRAPGQASAAIWERVDEVIETPIERAELENRVTNLLQRRELSLELKRRQEFTEERFRTLFESAPDPIVVVTQAGVVSEVNDAFVRLFDVDRDAVCGDHVSDIDAEPGGPVERVLLRVDGDGALPETETTVEVQSASGDTHVTELNVDVVEELGSATERIGIFRDVTARAESQRELERKVDQLEQFASVVSHDLREPLAVAKAKTRLARQECDSEKLDELDAVHDRMDDLLEDVLTLAKQGEPVGETEPVALDDVVTAAWATVETPSGATLEREGDLSTVESDPGRLQALLENLFANAVEHGGQSVTVTVGRTAGRGFYVADDGPGIPESERESVLEYRHTTTSEGMGLGLAIVREIAEAHGWTVTVTESDTGGARFEFHPV